MEDSKDIASVQEGTAIDVQSIDPVAENGELFAQLRVVQEALEQYYYRVGRSEAPDWEQGVDATTGAVFLEGDLRGILVEQLRLRTLVNVQRSILAVTAQKRTIACWIGEMLIKAVEGGRFLPGRLYALWRAAKRTHPPAILGGKDFHGVIKAFEQGGMAQVENLLNAVLITPIERANALTALAKHVMPKDAKRAEGLARLANEVDPNFNRLKWRVFRLHTIGKLSVADAMLSALPEGMSMSDSEERMAQRIKKEARDLYLQTVQQGDEYKKILATAEKKIQARMRIRIIEDQKLERSEALQIMKDKIVDLERQVTKLTEKNEAAVKAIYSVYRKRSKKVPTHATLMRGKFGVPQQVAQKNLAHATPVRGE